MHLHYPDNVDMQSSASTDTATASRTDTPLVRGHNSLSGSASPSFGFDCSPSGSELDFKQITVGYRRNRPRIPVHAGLLTGIRATSRRRMVGFPLIVLPGGKNMLAVLILNRSVIRLGAIRGKTLWCRRVVCLHKKALGNELVLWEVFVLYLVCCFTVISIIKFTISNPNSYISILCKGIIPISHE